MLTAPANSALRTAEQGDTLGTRQSPAAAAPAATPDEELGKGPAGRRSCQLDATAGREKKKCWSKASKFSHCQVSNGIICIRVPMCFGRASSVSQKSGLDPEKLLSGHTGASGKRRAETMQAASS